MVSRWAVFGLAAVACFGVLLAARPLWAAPTRVVVLPVRVEGVVEESPAHLLRALRETLRGLPGVKLVEAEDAKALLGAPLAERVNACAFELYCLVELGDILEADRMISPVVLAGVSAGAFDPQTLRFKIIDVPAVKFGATLKWQISAGSQTVIRHAVWAAMRRLFLPPDTRVRWVLSPEGAELRVYGEPVAVQAGKPMPFWSGVYEVEAEANGYESSVQQIEVLPGNTVREVSVRLRRVVATPAPAGLLGHGLGAQSSGAPPEPTGPSLFIRTVPWIVAGGAMAVGAGGVFLMKSAQDDYNAVAQEMRFGPDAVRASAASDARDSAKSKHRLGSVVAVSSFVIAGGVFVYILLDHLLADGSSPPLAVSHSAVGGPVERPPRHALEGALIQSAPTGIAEAAFDW